MIFCDQVKFKTIKFLKTLKTVKNVLLRLSRQIRTVSIFKSNFFKLKTVKKSDVIIIKTDKNGGMFKPDYIKLLKYVKTLRTTKNNKYIYVRFYQADQVLQDIQEIRYQDHQDG